MLAAMLGAISASEMPIASQMLSSRLSLPGADPEIAMGSVPPTFVWSWPPARRSMSALPARAALRCRAMMPQWSAHDKMGNHLRDQPSRAAGRALEHPQVRGPGGVGGHRVERL